MKDNLKVYWWQAKDGTPNFGDEITSVILEEIFGIKNQCSSIEDADLLGTGSVLDKLFKSKSLYKRKKLLHVIGSGLIEPKIKPVIWSKRWNATRKLPDCIKIHSVRGYLTQQILVGHGEDAYSVGDPGLLLPHLYLPGFIKKYKFGIIPHFSKVNDKFWMQVAQMLGGKIIDFRTKDYKKLLDEMLSCEIILSQGLHGLILSDAYQIPNVWVYNDSLHAGGKFKFYDYFSSIGRPFDSYISAEDLMDRKNIELAAFTSNVHVVSKLQEDIVKSFKEAFLEDC